MKEFDLKIRTQQFAISILKLLQTFPNKYPYIAINNQLTRAGMSVGANYRAAKRAKSTRDFIHKLKIVEEECDECLYFFEILTEINVELKSQTIPLHQEGEEISKIIVSTINKVKNNENQYSKF